MRRRNLLIGSLVAIAVGFYMWDIIGPMLAVGAGAFAYEGLWMRNLGVTGYGQPFWTGLMVSLTGFIILLVGIAGIIIAIYSQISKR